LARRLAADGAACLRLDFGGRGDSAGDPSAASIASMTEDARAALAWMRGQGPDTAPLAIVAICSGSKVAIGTAAEEPDVRTLCLWSPEPMGSLRPSETNRRKTRAALRTYLVKLLRPETWRKLLTGRVRGGMVGKALLRHETRSADEARREDAVLVRFRGYRGQTLAVFGGGDPEAAGSAVAYDAFAAQHGIPWEPYTIPRAGHSFYRADWAEALVERTRRRLTGAP
jgi:pimeloyl-ACP methyl ester carboxylesterase